MTSLFVLGFILHARPFNEPIMNSQEIVNESSVLLYSYALFYMTEFLEIETRYQLGWASIAIVGLNMLINFSFMGYVTVKTLIEKCKRRKLQKEVKNKIALRLKK